MRVAQSNVPSAAMFTGEVVARIWLALLVHSPLPIAVAVPEKRCRLTVPWGYPAKFDCCLSAVPNWVVYVLEA